GCAQAQTLDLIPVRKPEQATAPVGPWGCVSDTQHRRGASETVRERETSQGRRFAHPCSSRHHSASGSRSATHLAREAASQVVGQDPCSERILGAGPKAPCQGVLSAQLQVKCPPLPGCCQGPACGIECARLAITARATWPASAEPRRSTDIWPV